jgi:hypothetical protein
MKKKTEILKCRVDIGTVMEMKRRCQRNGENISELVRRSILRELNFGDCDPCEITRASDELEGSECDVAGIQARRHCAGLLASVLLGERCRVLGGSKEWQLRHNQVADLIERLLRALDFSTDPDQDVPFLAAGSLGIMESGLAGKPGGLDNRARSRHQNGGGDGVDAAQARQCRDCT